MTACQQWWNDAAAAASGAVTDGWHVDATPPWSLSPNKLVATIGLVGSSPGNPAPTVRSSFKLPKTGKRYIEVGTHTLFGGQGGSSVNELGIGVGELVARDLPALYTSNQAVSITREGKNAYAGLGTAYTTPPIPTVYGAADRTLMIAFDWTLGTPAMWWGVNGQWNGDTGSPTGNVNPANTGLSFPFDLYLLCVADISQPNVELTIRPSAGSWLYAAPAGYVSWLAA